MKVFDVEFNEQTEVGVYAISLVNSPAMESNYIALNKQEVQLKEVDSEKRILLGLVLEPNKLIYRKDENGEEFYIRFSNDVVEKLAHNFVKQGYIANSTIEHDNKQAIDGVAFVESWIVQDSEKDKSASFGLSYPVGTWVAMMKVDNDEVWNDYIKTGKLKGFSVDAMVDLKEVNNKNVNMSDFVKQFATELKEALGLSKKPEIKLGSLKDDKGETTFYFDGEMMAIGSEVWLQDNEGNRSPVPDGEYPLETGNIIVVVDSVVKEFKEPQADEPAPADAPVQMEQKDNEILNAIKSVLIKYSEDQKEILDSFKAELSEYKKENEKLQKQLVELSEQPAVEPIKSTPTANNGKGFLNRIRQKQ